MKLVTITLAALILSGSQAFACSFIPMGMSHASITSVLNAAVESEDPMSSVIAIKKVASSSGMRYELTLLGEDEATISTAEYVVSWTDETDDNIPCPSPKAKKVR